MHFDAAVGYSLGHLLQLPQLFLQTAQVAAQMLHKCTVGRVGACTHPLLEAAASIAACIAGRRA